MSNFFKAVWNKITATASWVKEALFDSVETSAYFATMSFARIGGLLAFASRWCLDKADRGLKWSLEVSISAVYHVMVAAVYVLRSIRWGIVCTLVFAHNLIGTFGLALQTPYLVWISPSVAKICWRDQVRRLFFMDGIDAGAIVAEVTWAHLNEKRINRKAEAAEKTQHKAKKTTEPSEEPVVEPVAVPTAQQPKGRPTAKRPARRPRAAFTAPAPA